MDTVNAFLIVGLFVLLGTLGMMVFSMDRRLNNAENEIKKLRKTK